jgi:hypothetical protein
MLRLGRMVEAIKHVRLERNLGLKEAKDLVDAYVRSQPDLQRKMERINAAARQTLVRWLIGILVLAAGAAYVFMQGG